MDPSEGYKEARKLLEKEYGDPFKVSMAFVNKANPKLTVLNNFGFL